MKKLTLICLYKENLNRLNEQFVTSANINLKIRNL